MERLEIKQLREHMFHIIVTLKLHNWAEFWPLLKKKYPTLQPSDIFRHITYNPELKMFSKQILFHFLRNKYGIVKMGVFTYYFNIKQNKWLDFKKADLIKLLEENRIATDKNKILYEYIMNSIDDGEENNDRLRDILIKFADGCPEGGGYFFSKDKAYKFCKTSNKKVELKEFDIPLWDVKKKRKIPYFQNMPFNKKIYNRLKKEGMDGINKKVRKFFLTLFKEDAEAHFKAFLQCTMKLSLRYSPLGLILIIFNSSGRNGKSKYLQLLSKLIPNVSTTRTRINTLSGNEFDIIDKIRNKTLIIQDETEKFIKQDIVYLKRVTSGLHINHVKIKFGPSSTLIFPQNYVASTNYTLNLDEDNYSMRERFKFVRFPRNFTAEDKHLALDSDNIDKLIYDKTFLQEAFTTAAYLFVESNCKIEDTKDMQLLYIQNINNTIKEFLEYLIERNGKISQNKLYKQAKYEAIELRESYEVWKTDGKNVDFYAGRKLPTVNRIIKVLSTTTFSGYNFEKTRQQNTTIYIITKKLEII